MKNVAIGIDIGGTNTVLGVVDNDGTILVRDSISTPDHGDINKYIDELSTSIQGFTKSVKLMNEDSNVLGIGVGAPKANYYKGVIEQAPNLSFKGIVSFVHLLKQKSPQSYVIAFTNDANAAVIGEMIYGGSVASGDLLFKPTIAHLEAYLLPIFKNKIKVLPTKLYTGDVAIAEASALV